MARRALEFTGAFAGAGDTLTLKAGPIGQIAAGVITAATLDRLIVRRG